MSAFITTLRFKSNVPYLTMNDPFDVNLVDVPPGPRPYTLIAPLTPFTVTLPDKILRIVFEMPIFDSQYAAKQLMLVARWVRLWLLQTFYALQRIVSKKHLQRLLLRPNSLLTHFRSIHVGFYHRKLLCELLERTPNLERLAVCQDALLAPSTRIVNAESKYKPYPDALSSTLRELETTSNGYWSSLGTAVYDLAPVAFRNVTHARLGFSYLSMLRQLSDTEQVILPFLTHLAFDVSGVDETFGYFARQDLVDALRAWSLRMRDRNFRFWPSSLNQLYRGTRSQIQFMCTIG